MNILIPKSLHRNMEQDDREAAHAEDLLRLTLKISGRHVSPLTDEHSRLVVQRVCSILMNERGKILISDKPTWPEVARVLSDVLLGHGVEYEVKT